MIQLLSPSKENVPVSINCVSWNGIVKINFEGEILFANFAGDVFLHALGCVSTKRLPDSFIDKFPDIFINGCMIDLQVEADGYMFDFSVVAFDEAGYVGLYGHSLKQLL